MKTKIITILCVALVGLSLAAGLAINYKRDTFFSVAVDFIIFFIGLPLFLIGLVIWRASKKRNSIPLQRTSTILLIISGLLFMQWFAGPIGQRISFREIQEAQDYCEALIPGLESYKQTNGNYPETLETILPQEEDLPFLLQSRQFYAGGLNYFRFSFVEPDSFIDRLYVYDSGTKSWHVED